MNKFNREKVNTRISELLEIYKFEKGVVNASDFQKSIDDFHKIRHKLLDIKSEFDKLPDPPMTRVEAKEKSLKYASLFDCNVKIREVNSSWQVLLKKGKFRFWVKDESFPFEN